MKRSRIDIVYNSLFFIAGILVCYAATQFRYLNIDTDINVWETLMSLASIVVGLFIAISLQKRFNKNQNLYNYLVNRLDGIWTKFENFNSVIQVSDKIEFVKVTALIRELQRKNTELSKLLVELDSIENTFELHSEQLLNLFEKSIQKDGIVYYDLHKDEIIRLASTISNNFISIYRAINDRA